MARSWHASPTALKPMLLLKFQRLRGTKGPELCQRARRLAVHHRRLNRMMPPRKNTNCFTANQKTAHYSRQRPASENSNWALKHIPCAQFCTLTKQPMDTLLTLSTAPKTGNMHSGARLGAPGLQHSFLTTK